MLRGALARASSVCRCHVPSAAQARPFAAASSTAAAKTAVKPAAKPETPHRLAPDAKPSSQPQPVAEHPPVAPRPSPVTAAANVGTPEYDVFIIGGGVTGSALLYELSHFTDIKRLGLVERRPDFAMVASGPNNNSQTIHCGDIETNYSYEKASTVKRQADLMRNYGTKLPEEMQKHCIFKMQKMVLGVGEDECAHLAERYEKFRGLFPRMELVSRPRLRQLEPNVVCISNHRERRGLINAIAVEGEHTAVNYYNLTASFIAQAKEAGQAPNKTVDVKTNTEVRNITENIDETYTVHTTSGNVKAKFVVVSACGYSLLFAQRLGYGLKYGCFPVAGSFYFSKRPVLNGKVYTVQDPKLPFAAVHGDPDIHAVGLTRFGPTALPLPLLERFNMSSFKDFFQVSGFDLRLFTILLAMFRDHTMIKFALRNIIFELPYFGLNQFLNDARKIVPGMSREDLVYAHGFGGVRPQLIDKKKMKLIMGEGKILGNNIIFNITPSPGGTTCLGNGEVDMRSICKTLGATVNEEKFAKTLLQGDYPVTMG